MDKNNLNQEFDWDFINKVNANIAKMAEVKPDEVTLTCVGCGERYIATKVADLSICPCCGKCSCCGNRHE